MKGGESYTDSNLEASKKEKKKQETITRTEGRPEFCLLS
jgi:hypothetical protein